MYEPSRPLRVADVRAEGCVFAPTEIDIAEGVVYPPDVTYHWTLDDALADASGHEQVWTSAAEATGLYDGHLAGAALLRWIGLPENDDELIGLLETIESWRWPGSLQRILGGDYPDLARPLRYNATGVLGKLAFAAEG